MIDLPERLASAGFFSGAVPMRLSRHRLSVPFPLHWHEFFELTVVIDGSGWNVMNGERHPIAAGDSWLSTPADFHSVEPGADTPLHLCNVLFAQASLQGAMADLLFARRLGHHVHIEAAAWQSVVGRLAAIEHEQQNREAGWELAMAAHLHLLLLDWHRQRRYHRPGAPRAEDLAGSGKAIHPGIQKALAYLQHHFRQPLSLEEAADQAHLSSAYFSELFHKATGTTFQQYLQRLRLDFAHALLRAGPSSVTEVALASGFNTVSHFTRVYTRVYGQPPSRSRS